MAKGFEMHPNMLRVVVVVCLGAFIAVAIAGCSSSNTSGGGTNAGPSGGMMGGGSTGTPGGSGGMMGGSGSSGGNYSSVGQRIFLTGVGSDGQSIPRASSVSQGSLTMSGGGCGSCHRANGRGGTIRMMMGTAIKTPDITYGALVKEGFTDPTIKRAILGGLDESGKQLNAAMPRWQMTNADVDATIAYLKTLGS